MSTVNFHSAPADETDPSYSSFGARDISLSGVAYYGADTVHLRANYPETGQEVSLDDLEDTLTSLLEWVRQRKVERGLQNAEPLF